MSNPELNDGFNKVRHGIPYDRELRAKRDTELAVLLGEHEDGSPAYLVIEREMQRRAAIEDAKLSRPKPSLWVHPVTRTLLYVVGVVLAGGILVFFGFK